MEYLRSGIAIPAPTVDDAPFWYYCRQHELRVQRCAACQQFRFPPKPRCPECLSLETEWVRLAGTGKLYTYTIVHNVVEPGLAGVSRYNVAVVALDDAEDVHMISNVVNVPDDELKIGMPLEVVWETCEDQEIPRFRFPY